MIFTGSKLAFPLCSALMGRRRDSSSTTSSSSTKGEEEEGNQFGQITPVCFLPTKQDPLPSTIPRRRWERKREREKKKKPKFIFEKDLSPFFCARPREGRKSFSPEIYIVCEFSAIYSFQSIWSSLPPSGTYTKALLLPQQTHKVP